MSSLYRSEPSVEPVRISTLRHRRAPAILLPSSPQQQPLESEPTYADFIGRMATAATDRLVGTRTLNELDAS